MLMNVEKLVKSEAFLREKYKTDDFICQYSQICFSGKTKSINKLSLPNAGIFHFVSPVPPQIHSTPVLRLINRDGFPFAFFHCGKETPKPLKVVYK